MFVLFWTLLALKYPWWGNEVDNWICFFCGMMYLLMVSLILLQGSMLEQKD